MDYQKHESDLDGWTIESERMTYIDKTRLDGVLGLLGSDYHCERGILAVSEAKGYEAAAK